jgi:ABC-2 type transport system ATP-binding protein
MPRPRITLGAMTARAVAIGVLVVLAVAAGAAARASAAKFTKGSYRVPVTQPDETGAPVTLDTDVYVPARRPPRRGFPLLAIFHGGGSDKTNGFDAGHARYFARHGYVVVLYSARGHGSSDGQTTIVGPKEVRDIYDVLAWVLGVGGRDSPAHPAFHADRHRIGLAGYSQGGLHTNLAQAHNLDPDLNPYGLRFRALAPGNTPDLTFQALVQNAVVKLSFGVGLMQTYLVGAHAKIAPEVERWIATAAADLPGLYGGEICEHDDHDSGSSTMKEDLAVRSPGCFMRRMTVPSAWAQAFDDLLFTPDMAARMWRRMPSKGNRLYLSMGGHGAPSASRAVERDKLRWQRRFLDALLRGRNSRARRVVYWARDPSIQVPGDAYAYPKRAWRRRATGTWPPPRARKVAFALSADGRATRGEATPGELRLSPLFADAASDPVASAAASATPVGTSIVRGLPASSSPGLLAAFDTGPFAHRRELAGPVRARLEWTPASPDSQAVLRVFDRAPDGTLTLLARGVEGMRGATPGEARRLTVRANDFAALIRRSHSLLTWISAADAPFYKAYPASLGGTMLAGPTATLTVRLRSRPKSH